MKAKRTKVTAIKTRSFIPDGAGGYRLYEELSASEKKVFGERLVQSMGDAINRYASAHPEVIPHIAMAAASESNV